MTVVSADELARQAVMPGSAAYQQIVACFGDAVVMQDGALDRKKLRKVITEDPEKKKKLESFTHPEIFRLMEAACEDVKKKGEPVIAIEVPLLFEAGMAPYFDFVLTVSVDMDRRVKRLMERDHITQAEAEALMALQLPEQVKIEQSDFVINNKTLEETRKSVEQFYQELIKRIKKA